MPARTQMTELNFSGSSVAIGCDDQREERLVHAERGRQVLDGIDEEDRSEHDERESDDDLEVHDRAGAALPGRPVRRRVEPMEPERREIARVDLRRRPGSGP